MSRATVDIEDVLLNERRRYHAELASQKKSLDYKRHELAKKIENLRQFARSIGDHITLDSLDEEMHQLYEQLNHEDEAHRAVLKKTVLAKIEQQMTASGQQFSLSRKLTASAMLDIIMLADGRRRDDAFYRQLAIDVRCGVLGNLHRELQRETKERGYADRAPSPEREAQKTERQLEDELFMQRVLRNGVKTVKERQREREREVSAMQTDDDDAVEEAPPEQEKKAVVHKRPRLEETPVPAAVPPPQPRASPPREVVVISDDGTWLDVAEFWKGVCEPQTVPACTPIAYMCAMRFATAVPVDAETYDDKVSALEYDRFVRNGTRLWEAWFENEQKKAPEKRNAWMHAVDVKNEKVLASIKASKLETFECAGPWLASSSIANRELYKPLAEWLEHIASLAQDGQFGTLFTLRTRTIAIGHCGNKYYVFDSHGGSEKAVLLCFSTLGKLVEGISRRFNRSHEVEQRELQKCHGDEFGLQKEFSYSLYAMYKPQGA